MADPAPKKNNVQLEMFGDLPSGMPAPDSSARSSKGTARFPPAKSPETQPTFLTVKQVAQRYGVSNATVWRWAGSDGPFPKPVRLSAGTSRWRLDDLLAYEAHLTSTDAGEAAPKRSGRTRSKRGAS